MPVHLRSPEWDFVAPRSFHQREELRLASCMNTFHVNTKRGSRGQAFGSFSLVYVMREDAPFTIQLWSTLSTHNTTVEYFEFKVPTRWGGQVKSKSLSCRTMEIAALTIPATIAALH